MPRRRRDVRRSAAVLGSAFFFLVAPCTLAGVIPWWITQWQLREPFGGWEWTRAAGVALIVAGVPGLVGSFARFALQGRGTPAPIAPPTKLVMTGLYRRVRNPMYASILAIVLGQAILLGDVRLLGYGAILWAAFHLFVVGYEEPTLEARFGAAYEEYRAHVPRWIPRLTPWRRDE
jgi:protein-S-isoprenylcysteine O-methyltransferase Ste14